MDADRWRRIEELCREASSRDAPERDAFLDEACAGDAELRQQVESLLAGASRAEGFLQAPVWQSPVLGPGTRLGSFEILGLLGAGGMGEVYQARDTRLDRLVALKILPPHISRDPEHRARFAREAKTISQLNHPHICTLHDIGEAQLASTQRPTPSAQYLVMEFLDGETLAARLAKGPLPLAQALDVGIQIADALAAAHRLGVVHRDLKPGNVMLTDAGAKLLDFGLAKLKAGFKLQAPGFGPEPSAAATESALLTGRGVIVGTLPYMAPEQVEGKPADARTDLWALGTILYEMLAGKRAFEGESSAGLIGAILEREPESLTARRPLTPRALDRLVRKCLAKDPEARWQSASDVAGELRWVASRPGGRRWTRVAAVAAVAVATIAVVAWLALRPGPGSSAGPRLDLSAAPRPLTAYPGIEKDPAISPDGNHVAFAWNGAGDGRYHVFVTSVEVDEPFQLTRADADDLNPVWSPGGDRIAFLRRTARGLEVWWASYPGREEKLVHRLGLTREPFLIGLDWSPDARYLATQDVLPGAANAAIVLLDTRNGEPVQLTFPPMDAEVGDSNPVFSPDGRKVAFFRLHSGGRVEICVQDVVEGQPSGDLQPVHFESMVYDLAWSPDGMDLLYTKAMPRGVWRVPTTGGEPALTTSALDARDIAVDRTGRRFVYAAFQGNADVWRMPGPDATAKTDPAPFIGSTRNDGQPRYSPDGSRVAFMSDRSGSPNIWLAAADGTGPRHFTNEQWAVFPQWSPDGDALAFNIALQDPQAGEIMVMGLTDAHPTPLTDELVRQGIPVWSRDGQWVFFNRIREEPAPDGTTSQIRRVPRSGGPSRLVADVGMFPFGTDDRFVYFTRAPYELSPVSIWRAPLDGGEASLVLDGPVYLFELAFWRAKLVYVDRFAHDGPEVRALDPATGDSTTLAPLDPAEFPSLAVFQHDDALWGGLTISPDGQWILYGKRTVSGADLMVVETSREGDR